MTAQRYQHPEQCGYVRIGRVDSPKRRSLWLRENADGSFEFRAGREGDDAYVHVTKDNPQYAALYDVATCARFAAEWEDSDGQTLERERSRGHSDIGISPFEPRTP